jgi:hypothetical protein
MGFKEGFLQTSHDIRNDAQSESPEKIWIALKKFSYESSLVDVS